ncbi:MAG: CRISPR-associated negative autoregulator [Bacteroidia bacterium]|nr:MAG: CRISPR-associated negative autoregulator [Bacteroidia bacterium]
MRYLTITVVYRAHALNRDEKIGQNVLSVKKLTYQDRIHTFISKPALRHYLFQTLYLAHHEKAPEWEPAPLQATSDVIQFDLTQASILTHAELDLFGYMQTAGRTLTRKAVVGITKAISLYPYAGDMAFYANHDLVQRLAKIMESTPNPYQKEEHTSLYKVHFVIDTHRLGRDEWILPKAEVIASDTNVAFKVEAKEKNKEQEQAEQEEDTAQKQGKKSKSKSTSSSVVFTIAGLKKTSQGPDHVYEHPNGKVIVKDMASGPYQVQFVLRAEGRRRRLLALIEALRGGLYAQSSGEANTLVPVAFVAAFTKVPVPILEPYFFWPPIPANQEGTCPLPLHPDVLNNPWYLRKSEEGGLFVSGVYGPWNFICPGALQSESLSEEEFKQRIVSLYPDESSAA